MGFVEEQRSRGAGKSFKKKMYNLGGESDTVNVLIKEEAVV